MRIVNTTTDTARIKGGSLRKPPHAGANHDPRRIDGAETGRAVQRAAASTIRFRFSFDWYPTTR